MVQRGRGRKGLGSIHERKDGLWEGRLDITRPGEPRRRKSVYGHSSQEVERKLGQLRRQLDQHGDIPSATTLGKWLDVWLEDIAPRKVKDSTMVAYRSKANNYIRPQLGHLRLDKIAPDHVREWDRWMRDRNLSKNTQQVAHVVLSSVLDAAMKDGKIFRNVAQLVGSPGREQNPPRSLSPAEIRAVEAAAKGTRLESRWLAAIMLGLRQGEALGLGWGQVDIGARTLHVTQALARVNGKLRVETPKSKSSVRVLYVPQRLLDALQDRIDSWRAEPRDSDWSSFNLVWANPDGSPRPDWVDYREWHDLLDRANVPRVSLHVARHSAATALAMEGIPVPTIRDILGHSSISITNGYLHPDIGNQAAAWEQVERRALDGDLQLP